MKKYLPIWLIGLGATLAVIVIPVLIFWPKREPVRDNPQAHVLPTAIHTSHADIIQGPFNSPQEVTRNCLTCHVDTAAQVMKTTHWTWESQPFDVPWRDAPITIGKINQINNFCIGAQGNQKDCASCHPGYGWEEHAAYDFSNPENVDCLICHADTALYAKGDYGDPVEEVDLTAAAQSVHMPARENCGKCHFDGGGGNGVKHGDLDQSLIFPSAQLDVHMGEHDFQCTSCHTTEDHQILGRLIADNYSVNPEEQVACTNCHSTTLHKDERINTHVNAVACQTCHIPAMAVKNPTKVQWDWTTAGQDRLDDHYTFLKIKGSFVYEKNFRPDYTWFNGNLSYRYLLGDKIDPSQPTLINQPAGSIVDSQARIFPFKIHIARQPYDSINNHLLSPITAGEDGFWTHYDWDQAFRLAEPITGVEYSGHYGFTETHMYWPTTHMVQPKENALQCTDCHAAQGRLDWIALGYPGDPMEWGGRFASK
ncbi:MAG: tetrathionate reductase family octaheme c-type cytochrome [Anaerolineaceae bacterium]|nr:tetrathionate reductase family octaheme c-type cytochrome [Anaerolineaceae bacterium]